MKYYYLSPSHKIKEVGKCPQSETAKSYGTIRNIDYEKFIIDDLIPPEPILEKKAKLTSYLNCISINSGKFLTLNKDFVKFLKNYNLSKFQLWNMNIIYNREILTNYILFHISYPSQEKFIDYENSEFYIGNIKNYQFIGDTIKITSYENFLRTREILRNQKLILKGRKLLINFKEAKEDLIRITDTPPILGTSGYFISEKLKIGIEKMKFSGMLFKEIEEVDNRIKVIY